MNIGIHFIFYTTINQCIRCEYYVFFWGTVHLWAYKIYHCEILFSLKLKNKTLFKIKWNNFYYNKQTKNFILNWTISLKQVQMLVILILRIMSFCWMNLKKFERYFWILSLAKVLYKYKNIHIHTNTHNICIFLLLLLLLFF